MTQMIAHRVVSGREKSNQTIMASRKPVSSINPVRKRIPPIIQLTSMAQNRNETASTISTPSKFEGFSLDAPKVVDDSHWPDA